MLCSEDVAELLDSFPPVEFAFAYGSGVVEQGGYKYEQAVPSNMPMLDVILVVEDSEKWHAENLRMNGADYTPILPLGSKYIAKFQEEISANLWFNAYVPMKSTKFSGRLMKYGVISKKHLMKDLTDWNRFYTAGRLQKPVHILKSNEAIQAAIQTNLESAVRTSLLLMPDEFEETDLYLAIASLSYVGDPRMYFGENPRKVQNLVTPIVPHYQNLYRNALNSMATDDIISRYSAPPPSTITPTSSNTTKQDYEPTIWHQNTSAESRWALSLGLPSSMRKLLSIQKREKYLSSRPPNAAAVRAAVGTIVARAASMQTLKGICTVGIYKGVTYALAKISKRFSPAT